MRGVPGLGLLVPLVHGEVGDPGEFEVGGGSSLGEEAVLVGELCAEFETERADALVDPLRIVVPHGGRASLGVTTVMRSAAESAGTPRLAASAAEMASASGAKVALVRRRTTSRRSRPQSPKPARTSPRSDLRAVPLNSPTLGMTKAEDGQGLLDLERGAQFGREDVAERDHGGEAHVWLVDAVVLDRFVIRHMHERRRQRDAGGGEGGGEEALGDAEDVVHLREGHFEVDLGELGLAVGAQVLVAEAAGDLEVAVEAGDHEDLLEDLRRLGSA